MIALESVRSRRGATVGLLFLVLLAARPAAALVPPAGREVQVALEPSGRLLEIDRGLARRLGLFLNDYPGFRTARLYQTGDSTFVLEVTVAEGIVATRQRIPMTPRDVDTLRRDVAERLAVTAPERLFDQDGRVSLVAGTTLLGLGFYGWAVPVAFEVDSPEGVLGLYMLVSGASFLVPFAATQHATVTDADADLTLYGATRGIAHGLLAREAIDPNHDIATDQAIGMALGASLVEGPLFYIWSRGAELDAGTTVTIGTLGDYGMLSAIGLASVTTGPGDLPNTTLGWSGLSGSAIGIVAGRTFARGRGYTRGDAGIMRTGTLVGAYTGAAIGQFMREDNGPDDPWIIGAVAGGGAGFLAGDALVRGRDFTHDQARLVAYGTVAGGLVGLGFAFISSADEEDTGIAMTAAGALLGYAAVYGALRDDALAAAGPGDPAMERRAGGLSWSINPVPLAARVAGSRAGRDVPVVLATWTWGEAR